MSRPDRSLAGRILLGLIPWIPLFIASWMVWKWATFSPFYDDWDILMNIASVHSGDLPWTHLFTLHSEHNITTARLVLALLAHAGPHTYELVPVYHLAALSAAAFLLGRLIRRTFPTMSPRTHAGLWLLVNFMLFHPLMCYNWDWVCQVTVANVVLFLLLAITAVECGLRFPLRFGLAAAAATAALFSHGGGVVAFAAVSVWLFFSDDPALQARRRWGWLAAWCALGAAIVLGSLAAAGTGAGGVAHNEGLSNFTWPFSFPLVILGNPLGHGTPLPGVTVPFVMGLVILTFCLTYVSAWLFDHRLRPLRGRAAPWLALMTFGLCSALLIATQRVNPVQAFSHRYIIYVFWTLPALVMLHHLAATAPVALWRGWFQSRRIADCLLTSLTGLLLLGGGRGMMDAEMWHLRRTQAIAEEAFVNVPGFPEKPKGYPPFSGASTRLRHWVNSLAALDMLPYPVVLDNNFDDLAARGYTRAFKILEKQKGASTAMVTSSVPAGRLWRMEGYAWLVPPADRMADAVLITSRTGSGSRKIIGLAQTAAPAHMLHATRRMPREMGRWQIELDLPPGEAPGLEAWSVDIQKREIRKIAENTAAAAPDGI